MNVQDGSAHASTERGDLLVLAPRPIDARLTALGTVYSERGANSEFGDRRSISYLRTAEGSRLSPCSHPFSCASHRAFHWLYRITQESHHASCCQSCLLSKATAISLSSSQVRAGAEPWTRNLPGMEVASMRQLILSVPQL